MNLLNSILCIKTFYYFLASWTYDRRDINLLKLSEVGDTSNFIKNGEWTLEG